MEELKLRAQAFLLRLVAEVEKRLPADSAVFKQRAFFSASVALSNEDYTRFSDMPHLSCVWNDVEVPSRVEQQWREVQPSVARANTFVYHFFFQFGS